MNNVTCIMFTDVFCNFSEIYCLKVFLVAFASNKKEARSLNPLLCKRFMNIAHSVGTSFFDFLYYWEIFLKKFVIGL